MYKRQPSNGPKTSSGITVNASLTKNTTGPIKGGTEVEIFGTNFKSLKVIPVLFGQPGSTDIKIVSDTKITATSPATSTPGPVNIAVVNGKGKHLSAGTFTYETPPNNGVPMEFKPKDAANTYVQFVGSTSFDAYYYNQAGVKESIVQNKGYCLADMISTTPVVDGAPVGLPTLMVKAMSGRVYLSFGSAIPGISTNIPNAADSSVDSVYQYFEATVKDSTITTDLSYIDFTAFTLSLIGKKAPNGSNLHQVSSSTKDLVTAAAGSALTKNGSVLPKAADMYPSNKFLRVISPQLGESGLYHDFTYYIHDFLQGKSIRLAGIYTGNGTQPTGNPLTQIQTYDYTGIFKTSKDPTTSEITGGITLTPSSDSGNGSANGIKTKDQGQGVGHTNADIVITFKDLNKNVGAYGCNAAYTAAGVSYDGIKNDFYGQVVGDLLSALNFGYAGSTKEYTDSNGNRAELGTMQSTQWWGGHLLDGTHLLTADSPGGQGIYFEKVQSDVRCYNSYAASISTLTTGYGFPFQDRLGANLLSLSTSTDQDAYVQVWVDEVPVTDF